MKNKPQIPRACLIALLFSMIIAVGCGHTAALQKSTPTTAPQTGEDGYTVVKPIFDGTPPTVTYPVLEYPVQGSFIQADSTMGFDCEAALSIYAKEIEALRDNNSKLDERLQKCESLPRRTKNVVKGSYNTKDSYNETEIYNLKRANQQLAKDYARLQADSATQAQNAKIKPKDVDKNVGNTDSGNKTKSKEKQASGWWWILLLGYAGGKWGGLLIRRIWPGVDLIPVIKWLI